MHKKRSKENAETIINRLSYVVILVLVSCFIYFYGHGLINNPFISLKGALAASDGIIQVAREGDPAPDSNGTFSSFVDINPEGPNERGQATFFGFLTGTNGGGSDNGGIFVADSRGIIQVARKGDPAPDSNGTFSGFSIPQGPNARGQATFNGFLIGTSDNEGIFVADSKGIIQVAREGDPAPDGNGTFSSFVINPEGPNERGQATFLGDLTGTNGGGSDNTGIFVADSRGIIQVARKGDPAPDSNGTFSGFLTPQGPNARGQATFKGFLTGTSGGDDTGIFVAD